MQLMSLPCELQQDLMTRLFKTDPQSAACLGVTCKGLYDTYQELRDAWFLPRISAIQKIRDQHVGWILTCLMLVYKNTSTYSHYTRWRKRWHRGGIGYHADICRIGAVERRTIKPFITRYAKIVRITICPVIDPYKIGVKKAHVWSKLQEEALSVYIGIDDSGNLAEFHTFRAQPGWNALLLAAIDEFQRFLNAV